MTLHSDYPYWMIKEGLKSNFPKLAKNIKTDVLIIGGGISGALIGHYLCEAGLNVTIAEKRHVAHGSTSASTAMLQYEIDEPLFKLMAAKGKQDAVRSYQICLEAIDKLAALCKTIPGSASFERHPSLLYASYKKHVPQIIEPEYEARKENGFKVKLLRQGDIEKMFGFSAPSAILSEDGAQVNPYVLANYLFEKIIGMGGHIYDLTEIKNWEPGKKKVEVVTADGQQIEAKYVIIACGYESQNYLTKDVSRLHSTYAIVTKPLPKNKYWYKSSLIWETKTPYLYIRTTGDNRIIIGGRDEDFYNPEKRDRLITKKGQQLQHDFEKLFPQIPIQIDFEWAGTFAETADGLPYIGSYDHPRILFAMGYGGNGITFSVAAAEILRDHILGKKNEDARLFGFDRKTESSSKK